MLVAQTDTQPYSFFIAGHSSGHFGLLPPFKNKFRYIQSRTEIKFGVFTGDIVRAHPSAQDWDYVDSAISQLALPIYFAAGNHDMENRALYESRYGNTYYHFKYQNDLFVVLDPNIDRWNISGDQLKYFSNVIKDNYQDVNNVFVFFHQLLWWEADNVYAGIMPNSKAGRANSINFWTEVEPILNQIPNRVVMFAGDVGARNWSHDFMYDSYDNISLVASGMGDGIGDNFVVINVDAQKNVKYDLICLNDSVLNCFGQLTDFKITPQITGVNLLPKLDSNSVYPNPATNTLTIELDRAYETIIRIFNMQGQLMLEKKSKNKSSQTLDVSQLTEGIYIIKTNSEVKKSMIKFVVH